MFILSIHYIKPIEQVEQQMQAHILFLEEQYAAHKFICSGRKIPRTGGVILCNAQDRAEVEAIVAQDPFSIHQVAQCEIIEFAPTKCVDGFEKFI